MNKILITTSIGVLLFTTAVLAAGVFTYQHVSAAAYNQIRSSQERFERLQQRHYETTQRHRRIATASIVVVEQDLVEEVDTTVEKPQPTKPTAVVATPKPVEPEAATQPEPRPVPEQTGVTVADTDIESELPAVSASTGSELTTAADEYLAVLAAEIHRLTNLERSQVGVKPLTFSTTLSMVSTDHSEDMRDRDFFAHTNPDGCNAGCRLDAANYEYSAWGENIAWRSSSQLPEAEELAAHFVENWMNSTSHRKNILSSAFTHEGIGLAQIGTKVYVTATFATPR